MDHLDVCEVLLNIVKVLLISKRQVVDCVGVIEGVTLSRQHHLDVPVGVRGNVEVAWYSIYLEASF